MTREELVELAVRARKASFELAVKSSKEKNAILKNISMSIRENAPQILEANRKDLENARANGVKEAFCDRLLLTEERIRGLRGSLDKVIELDDPVGKSENWTRPNGLVISRVKVPIGVIGIIYEARPNVTLDAAALCLKSGNSVILRGGKEAILSNTAICDAIRKGLVKSSISPDCVCLIEDTSRELSNEFIRLSGYVDLIIPRGGAGLIKNVVQNATVPVIETGAGNCHLYVHKDACVSMAVDILINAKVQRPSVCNAIENLIVDKDIAKEFLPVAAKALAEHNVEIRAHANAAPYLDGFEFKIADEADFYTEYNDYIISVKVVDGIDDAIEHINEHNTGHSEAIVTSDMKAATYFSSRINAAAVYTNASTRFTDGEEFGFGAEIGISTGKLHARGPMGLNEMTTVKYIIKGNGQIRQ